MRALPTTHSLLLEEDDGWLTVWLNRPEARNALSNEMAEELKAVTAAVAGDRSVRGVTVGPSSRSAASTISSSLLGK